VVLGALQLLLATLVVMANAAFREMASANRGSIHAYQVLGETERLATAHAEVETAYHGFGITGDPRFMDAWHTSVARWRSHADAIGELTADNPVQEARLRRLAALSDSFLASQREAMTVLRHDSVAMAAARTAASDAAALDDRRHLATGVRDELAALERNELSLLRLRSERARQLERETEWLVLVGGIVAVLLAVGAGALVIVRTRRLDEVNRLLRAEAAERVMAQQATERSSRRTELILNAAADGIYGIDANGYTTFANPAAAAMLGYTPGDLPGRPYESTLLAQWKEEDLVRGALRSGQPRVVTDAAFRRADGTRFPVELTCSPIVEDGHVAGAVITFRDVTERREMERMKDEFVSMVSHELRTPLTAIRGSLGLMAAGKAGEVAERGQRMLDIAVQNTDRLIRLINDILDIERIESGKVPMEPRPVWADDLVKSAAEVMLPMAERAGVRLEVQGEPLPLVADGDRVLQVLTNLISNALKFSPPDTAVEVSAEPSGGNALFRVRDRGRGIPLDRLESVFERFQQVDSSDAREKGGTGLGLAICRSIVSQHGGRIWAESEPGAGSTFSFTIPLTAAPVDPRATPSGDS
jgi:PAS domain S-box-containing protein